MAPALSKRRMHRRCSSPTSLGHRSIPPNILSVKSTTACAPCGTARSCAFAAAGRSMRRRGLLPSCQPSRSMASYGSAAVNSKRFPVSCAKPNRKTTEWRRIKYMIFELPNAPGTFAGRAQRIREIAAKAQSPQLVAVEQFRVADRAALKKKLDEVVRGGGEGLMLHLADCPLRDRPQRCAVQVKAAARYRSRGDRACSRQGEIHRNDGRAARAHARSQGVSDRHRASPMRSERSHRRWARRLRTPIAA